MSQLESRTDIEEESKDQGRYTVPVALLAPSSARKLPDPRPVRCEASCQTDQEVKISGDSPERIVNCGALPGLTEGRFFIVDSRVELILQTIEVILLFILAVFNTIVVRKLPWTENDEFLYEDKIVSVATIIWAAFETYKFYRDCRRRFAPRVVAGQTTSATDGRQCHTAGQMPSGAPRMQAAHAQIPDAGSKCRQTEKNAATSSTTLAESPATLVQRRHQDTQRGE